MHLALRDGTPSPVRVTLAAQDINLICITRCGYTQSLQAHSPIFGIAMISRAENAYLV